MQKYSGADGEDEDKETLMTFKAEELLGEPDSPDDEWVATHTGGGKGQCLDHSCKVLLGS